ncbi:mTERF domain-containing protein 1, mitochondrial, partial [Dufourea novaeangliae]
VNKNQPAILNEHNSENITVLGKFNHDLDDALYDINEKPLGPLDVCSEDLSHIEPRVMPTYNFARFANDSITIQQLVKLGVELYKLEADRDVVEMILSLDFDKDIKPYIRFLNDCGVPPENLGKFITNNPKIFKEDLDDLHTRIRYLMAHHFSPDMVQKIINSNPFWLSFKIKDIDRRLGYFQHHFKLNGHRVRLLAVKCPRLITYQMKHLMENTFAVREEMGFDKEQTQLLLMRVPRLWMNARSKIMNSFDYAHNVMKLSHEILVNQPQILTCRKIRLQQRHSFLTELKKTQYDPTKPLYVSPLDIVSGNDIKFCKNVAKASINTYNMFLKSI